MCVIFDGDVKTADPLANLHTEGGEGIILPPPGDRVSRGENR